MKQQKFAKEFMSQIVQHKSLSITDPVAGTSQNEYVRKFDAHDITVEMLRAAIAYDAETGELSWISDDSQYKRKPGKVICGLDRGGYIRINFMKKTLRAHRVAWAIHFGQWPTDQLDHVNRVKTDNRIKNLRMASASENTANQGLTSRNRHGLKGVTPKNGRWQAAIGIAGKVRYLGCFDTKEEASQRHAAVSREVFGDFAVVGGAL